MILQELDPNNLTEQNQLQETKKISYIRVYIEKILLKKYLLKISKDQNNEKFRWNHKLVFSTNNKTKNIKKIGKSGIKKNKNSWNKAIEKKFKDKPKPVI